MEDNITRKLREDLEEMTEEAAREVMGLKEDLDRHEKFIKNLFHYMQDMKDKLMDPQEMHSGFYSLGCILTRIGMFIEKEYLEQNIDEKDI